MYLYKSFKKIINSVLIAVLLLGLNANPAHAATCTITATPDKDYPLQQLLSIECVIARIIDTAVLSIGVILVIMVFYGSVKYSMAQGDPKGLAGAKMTLTWALAGTFIVVGVYSVYGLIITNILGVSYTTTLGSKISQVINDIIKSY